MPKSNERKCDGKKEKNQAICFWGKSSLTSRGITYLLFYFLCCRFFHALCKYSINCGNSQVWSKGNRGKQCDGFRKLF